jgi:S1-C subfamily serine protease
VDKNYYFVLEPDGDDEGPYVLSEIRRRIELGLLSKNVTVCRVGETDYLPVTSERYANYFEPPRRVAHGTQPLGIQMDKPAVVDSKPAVVDSKPAVVDAKPAVSTDVVDRIKPAIIDAKPAASTNIVDPTKPAVVQASATASSAVVHQAKPADTPPSLEALTAAINAATTIVEPLRALTAEPARAAAPTSVEPARVFAPVPSSEPARVAADTPAEPVRAMGSARVIDVAPIAAPKMAAIDVAAIDASQSDMARLDLVQLDVSASDMHAIDAVTIETAPVPRIELDLIDAPTQLDPVSGTVIDAATGFEDLAPTGPFEGVPSMVIDEAPREVLAPLGETLPPGFAPVVEAMPPGFVPPSVAPVRRLEAPRASEVRALEIRDPRMPLPLLPPPSASLPGTFGAAVRSRVPSKKVRTAIAGGVMLAAAAAVFVATRGADGVQVKQAMVRVTTPSATGAGFLIDGPDRFVYVATANHVIDRGERVLIEREVGADKHAFVEAFPETEIVASDPDADLAIIRIKNVDKAKFVRLPLAKEPVKDARILSYGYPGSSLAKHAGLVSKDGKVLSLVSFPAYDERYGRIVRENAVEGLLISTDIEPGFSGGPTTNEAGEVVGVNVTKDRAHVGQNGAVSVTALRALVKTIKPAGVQSELKADDVVALLKKTQSEYLLLPLDERSKVRESEVVYSADLPQLRRLVGEVRREEGNTDTSFIAKYKLSGQAALGIYFARLPGKLLETYRAPSTTGPLELCELRNQHLTSFLGDLTGGAEKHDRGESVPSPIETCDELAVRPLAWDLVAATLQWDGKEKEYAVTKLERMDDEGRVYRASVRMSGAPNLVEIWVGLDQGQVRLKLFDPTNSLYAIKSARSVASTALQGTWTASRPRVTDALNKDAEVESDETLSISIDDGRKVSLRYVITERYFSAGSRPKAFRCNHKTTIETGLLQSFTGTLDNGVVVALPEKEAETIGVDAAYCDSSHRPDRIVAAKLQGTQLVLYRTDGNAYPETIELAKQ